MRLVVKLIVLAALGLGVLIAVGTVMTNREEARLMALRDSDPEAYERETQAEVDALEALLRDIPATDYPTNIEHYERLVVLRPDEARYQAKVNHYRQKWADHRADAARREAEAEAARTAEERRKGFHCLSKWDGSHTGVVTYLKERLHDRDSFEHVETRITPEADGQHRLMMTYRAKNGFGALRLSGLVATVDHETCRATILETG